jgi:hypothetical protein
MRRRVRVLAVLGALLAADQIVQLTLLRGGRLGTRALAPFDPPLFTAAQEEAHRRLQGIARGELEWTLNVRLDAELGWAPLPGSTYGECSYDAAGARIGAVPIAPERRPDVARVVVAGCSFTHGDEVRGEETWPGALDARRADVEVVNLGVGAYGLDQALLRLRRDGLRLAPDEVWMGLLPVAALRVLDQYPPAGNHDTKLVAFKPRFVLGEAGELELVPCPAADVHGVLALLGDADVFHSALAVDPWVSNHPAAYAARGSHWTHYFATARFLLTWDEGRRRDPHAWLRDPASEVHRLQLALARAARDDGAAAGARFRYLILPGRRDLSVRSSSAAPAPWAGLVETLERDGIEVIDLSDTLLAAGALEIPERWQPGGHYGPELNAAVAERLSELLPAGRPR